MPEGPSIVILREEAAGFVGQRILRAEGNAKIDMTRLPGKRVESLRSFGKQTLIELPDVTIRIHLLMFGSYRVNERKEVVDEHVAAEAVADVPLGAGVATRVDQVDAKRLAEERPLRGPVLDARRGGAVEHDQRRPGALNRVVNIDPVGANVRHFWSQWRRG